MEKNSETYNLALDCIDKHAHSLVNKHKTALIYLKEESPSVLREPPLRLSFGSLLGLTNAAASMFKGLEIPPGGRVILRLPNAPEFPINFLGAVKAGLIPIPTSPLLTWNELEFLLQDSGASVLVTTQELFPPELSKYPPSSLKQVLLICEKELPQTFTVSPLAFRLSRWQDLLKNASAIFTTEATSAAAPAYWLYTSGTTGQAKAVIHAHRSIRAHDERAKLWQDVKKGDIVFNTSALNWSYALTCGMLDVWRHGLTSVIFQGTLTPENICRIVQRHGVTTFMSVPGIYRRLVRYSVGAGSARPSPHFADTQHPGEETSPLQKAFSQIRVCLSAGESLSAEIRAGFKLATGLEIHEGLGMTEHSVYLVQPYSEAPVPDSCGKPLPDHRVAILREDLTECEVGEVGTLASHRSCAGLMLGYHQRPEEEAEYFRGEWFLSGDLAVRDAEGNFQFLGRSDDVLTSGGYRISPMEVEAVLNCHEAVSESAAVGLGRDGKTLIQAFIVLKENFPANQEMARGILDFAATQLAKYKLPHEIVFLRELPKTSNEKIQRKILKGVGSA